MMFNLDQLNLEDLESLKRKFESIPKTVTEIEFNGSFRKTDLFKSDLAIAIYYLPKHINHIKFSGMYDHETYHYREESGRTWQPGNGYVTHYRTRTGYTKRLGGELKNLISSLPPSVNRVSLNFIAPGNIFFSRSDTNSDYRKLFKQIPNHITHLSFGNAKLEVNYRYLCFLLQSLPNTLTALGLGCLKLGRMTSVSHNNVFEVLSLRIRSLDLSDNELCHLNAQELSLFFQGFSGQIETLILSRNSLYEITPDALRGFLAASSQSIRYLALNENNLSALGSNHLAYILSSLPKTIEGIDLSDNGLLFLEYDDLITVLRGLPPTIKKLRLCESGLQNPELLRVLFSLLPETIDTLNVSDSDLYGLSLADFVDSLLYLPPSITTLDMSGCHLADKILADFSYAFSRIPHSITTLKLNRNNLSSANEELLRVALSVLPKTVLMLDWSENGLDRLSYSQLNQKLYTIPRNKFIGLDANQFGVRNDGVLVAYPRLPHQGLFKPKQRLKYRKEFGDLRLIFSQMIEYNLLSLDAVLLILTFLWNPSSSELKEMGEVLEISLIPATPPQTLTSLVQQETIDAVKHRISLLSENETRLDLSRCGLNRLSEDMFANIVNNSIPDRITDLILRGNGFQYDEEKRRILILVLQKIPEHVIYIDLSAHGFEWEDASRIEELFRFLPAHVQLISLSHEKPLSPAEHIAKRRWPESYLKFMWGTRNILQKARDILDDYTKGDSAALRFFTGHWNRHYIKETAKLVEQIDRGIITNLPDLFYEFEQLNIENQTGSLARRLQFLLSQEAKRSSPENATDSSINEEIFEFVLESEDLGESSNNIVLN